MAMSSSKLSLVAPPIGGSEADRRRDDVIRSAAELFSTRGYHATSMRDIAEAVGLQKPTLYHYFRSKDAILFRIHNSYIDLLSGRMLARLNSTMAPKIIILEGMGDILELNETHPGYVRIFHEGQRELPPERHVEIMDKRSVYIGRVHEAFERGMADGSIKRVDIDLAAKAMFGMCTFAYTWYEPSDSLRARDIAATFWEHLMTGLATA